VTNRFVSFLRSVGGVVVKVVNIAIGVEQKAEPFVEAALPQTIPIFSIADRAIALIKTAEGSYAAVGQAANGPAKLAAVESAISQDFDAWIRLQLPGDVKLQDAENYAASKKGFINSLVQALNSFSATQQIGAAVATGEALIAASAANAANLASIKAAPAK
jgi:hypothetical protein